jgi:hypothetical protein
VRLSPQDFRRHSSGVQKVRKEEEPLAALNHQGQDTPFGAPSNGISLVRLRPRRA